VVIALTANRIEVIALVVIAGLVVVGALVAATAARIQAKVIALVITLGLAALVWSQRASLSDCADDVRDGGDATCTFFGFDVDVDVPG
jgi:hypothetical protein